MPIAQLMKVSVYKAFLMERHISALFIKCNVAMNLQLLVSNLKRKKNLLNVFVPAPSLLRFMFAIFNRGCGFGFALKLIHDKPASSSHTFSVTFYSYHSVHENV